MCNLTPNAVVMNFYDYLVGKAEIDDVVKIVVGAVIIDEHGRILLVKRKLSDFMGGIYEIPSGNVELGEGIPHALSREIKEETNLDLRKVVSLVDWFDYQSRCRKKSRQFNFVVSVECCSAQILLSEHEEYKWAHYSDIENLSDITSELRNTLLIAAFTISQTFETET